MNVECRFRLFGHDHDHIDGGLADILGRIGAVVSAQAHGAGGAGQGLLGAVLVGDLEGAALDRILGLAITE